MIWQFSNTHSYLLGSVHLLSESGNAHLDVIDEVYATVENVVFEASLYFEEIPIRFYEKGKLSSNISKSLFRDAKKEWQKHKLDYSEFVKSKIWNATNSIAVAILNKAGFFPEYGIDRNMWDRSCADRKNIEWLESQSAVFACFDNAPIEEQINGLIKTVRDKKSVIEQMVDIAEGWKECDEERLSKVLQSCLNEYPVMFNDLINKRNSIWADKFISIIESKVPTLFVVGALHCVGSCSIQSILNGKYGYGSMLFNSPV